jgi:hypothetical protein
LKAVGIGLKFHVEEYRYRTYAKREETPRCMAYILSKKQQSRLCGFGRE